MKFRLFQIILLERNFFVSLHSITKGNKTMGTIYLILFEAILLVCLFIALLLWRSQQKNKMLAEENQRLRAEVERREQERLKEETKSVPPSPKDPTAQEQLFHRLCQLMDSAEQIYTDPDLDRSRLARLLGTNEHYVSDAVSACTHGGSITDFVNGYRLRHAVHLLTTTNDSIALIAELSGFSRRSFYRLFDEAYSMSPSEYRKTVKK